MQSNHPSAYQNKKQVEKEIKDQIANSCYVIADRPPVVVSALAAIPKDDGSVRLIHDGSRPVGSAMNDYSLPESVKFQTLRDACRLALPNYYCAKIDLKSAYRSVPIHPGDYNATGLQWIFEGDSEPTFFFDTRLPFGSNKAPSHFNRLSQAIRRCMVRRGFKGVVAYIDDFFICAPTYEECKKWMFVLLKLLRKLGFSISYKKVVGPTQQLTFLGLQINTVDSTLTLSETKLQKLKQQLSEFSAKTRATKQQLQRLAGSLNYATQAVRGGRFFLRRILDAMQHLKHARHKARLSAEFHSDIQWWLSFLTVFNGTVYYSSIEKEHVHVDACNAAAGAFWCGHWKYLVFDHDLPSASPLHINYKEVCAVVMAVSNWLPMWQRKTVIVHTDSVVTQCIINRGWCKNRYVNILLRQMAFQCARLNCVLKAVHVPGTLNIMADTISRLHEPNKINLFLQLISRWFHGPPPSSQIQHHMSMSALLFLFDKCRRDKISALRR